jgi:heptaprenyl diphosphate synthase
MTYMTETDKKNDVRLLTFAEALERTREEVDGRLSASPALIRKYTDHLRASKGKFIRAMSLLACALDEDDLIHPDAVSFASAVEILHLATLVHDDIIDNAKLRRGVVTLHRKFGRKTAVICGDYLFSVALKVASSVADRKKHLDIELPDYIGRICLGELLEHLENGNLDLSVYKYLKIISGKTAALFEASFAAGVILSGNDEKARREYMRLGRYVGIIFQLVDDCIDYEETEKTARKPVRSDFEQGVVTLPLIYALNRVEGLKQRTKAKELSAEELAETVRKADGISFTRTVARKYYDKSLAVLGRLSLSGEKHALLMEVLDKAFHGVKKKGSD